MEISDLKSHRQMRSSRSYVNDTLNYVSLKPNKPGNAIFFNVLFCLGFSFVLKGAKTRTNMTSAYFLDQYHIVN